MPKPTIEGWTGWTPGKVILAIVVLATFGVWGYAYSGKADRVPLDTLDDPSFAIAAEPICAEAAAELATIPNAAAAQDNEERADQIRHATTILEELVTELDGLYATGAATGTDRDVGIIDTWLGRWKILIGDRFDYADRIETDPNAVFYISQEAGRRAEASIDYVAEVNRMPSCVLPSDVG